MNHEDVLRRRAAVVGTIEQDCDVCGVSPTFLAEVDGSALAIDLPTILKCLRLAERQGAVSPLPDGWWTTVAERYDIWWHVYHGGIAGPCRSTSSDRRTREKRNC